MSYTEYLRRKDAQTTKVLSTQKPTDASMYITKVRMAANQDFAASGGRVGVVNSGDYSSMAPLHQVLSYQKVSGGRTPDASAFTAYRGGQAIGADVQAGLPTGKVTLQPCYTITPTTPAQSASDFVRKTQGCKVALGQPHDAATVDKPKFVDNTIRNLGDPALCTVPVPNHNQKSDMPHRRRHPARPVPSVKGDLAPGKEVGAFGGNANYKVGAALRRPQNYQIFKEDTNVGTTSAKPVPRKYQIPANSPAHLKINDPIAPRTA
jgi:hypothetical protein